MIRLLIVLLIVLNAACSSLVWKSGAESSAQVETRIWRNEFIFSLWAADEPFKASKICEDVSQISVQRSPVQLMIGLVTLGLYTPTELKFFCVEASTSQVGTLNSSPF